VKPSTLMEQRRFTRSCSSDVLSVTNQPRQCTEEYRLHPFNGHTFRTLHFSQPAYLYSALHAHHSTRALTLLNTNRLFVPFVRTSFGARSYSIAAPKIWNSLPSAGV